MGRQLPTVATLLACLPAAAVPGGGPWISFANQTATRLVSDPVVGAADVDEKDYAWDDVDHDGDIDLVVARKQPYSTPGGRRDVLFVNEAGVLMDRTAQFIPGFLDATNDRDVQLVDVNNDSWADIVTAAACNGCNIAGIADDSRLYLNLGSPGGTWLGFGPPTILIQGGNNLTAVAAGDVTGDGYADLYFVSAQDSFEDQLLVNGGAANPGAFTVENSRLTPQMLASNFGTSAVIADVNGDGWRDITKNPETVVKVLYNAGGGIFQIEETVYNSAAYSVAAGHLDGDGKIDLVVGDDGLDRYLLNLGNGGDGLANFGPFAFPAATNGFAGNMLVSDLDADGWNDVIIADVDPALAGCIRISDILRNNADAPALTFAADSGNIPADMLQGVFDVAAFDIDGDGSKDLVVGRCSGTQVWIATPFASVGFGYPGGLPQFASPGTAAAFQVQLTPVNATIDPDSPALHLSVNSGPFTVSALEPLGANLYLATLPALECADRVEFYLTAQISSGQSFIDPPGAPAATYAVIGAAAMFVLFSDHIEGDITGWTVTSHPSLTAGQWEQADPNTTILNNQAAAPEDDATPGGTMAFVTGNAPPGSTPQVGDVDFGPTYLLSPVFDLEDSDASITFTRWAFSSLGVQDSLITELSNDGGTSWTPVNAVANTGSSWQTTSFMVSDFLPPTSQVRVRFGVCDCPNDSVTEAGIDDFRVEQIACTPPCPWDLDRSSAVDIADFLALLAAWGSDPGGPPDFDGDGVVGITDFLALLANWGSCP